MSKCVLGCTTPSRRRSSQRQAASRVAGKRGVSWAEFCFILGVNVRHGVCNEHTFPSRDYLVDFGVFFLSGGGDTYTSVHRHFHDMLRGIPELRDAAYFFVAAASGEKSDGFRLIGDSAVAVLIKYPLLDAALRTPEESGSVWLARSSLALMMLLLPIAVTKMEVCVCARGARARARHMCFSSQKRERARATYICFFNKKKGGTRIRGRIVNLRWSRTFPPIKSENVARVFV